MLEATLMDKNAQKRGELEPVIRHSVNLSIANKEPDRDTFTFFVADEVDINVNNIFRATAQIELESTQNKDKFINGVKIFSLDTQKLVYLIKHKPEYEAMLNTIFDDYSFDSPITVNNDWCDKVWIKVKAL